MILDEGYVLAHSLTFDERLALLRSDRANIASDDPAAQAVVASRLELFRRRLTLSNGRTMFMARLNRGNIPLSLAAAACSPEFRFGGSEPEWLRWFLLGVENLAAGRTSSMDCSLPFDDLLGAFEASALTRIQQMDQPGHWNRLSGAAKQSASVWLRRRLCAVLQWCFYDAFDAFRRQRSQAADSYKAFIELAASPVWAAKFFTRYAGTARLVASVIEGWCDNVLLLLKRLHEDEQAIAAYLQSDPDVAIDCFERFPSDPHGGGQSVAIIRLKAGARLVYKPTDQTLATLWSRASNLCFGDSPRTSAPLVRAGYGWHSYVEPEPAPQAPEAIAFSLGRALALGTAIGSTDMHFENFIPTSVGLTLVDHETILSPRVDVRRAPGTRAQRAAFSDIADSILVTGALPRWSTGPGGVLWNADAFGWQVQAGSSKVFPFIVEPNTDHMSISADAASRVSDTSAPTGVGLSRQMANRQVIAEGFRDGWNRVRQARGELATLLSDSAPTTVRVVLRSTREYSELLGQGYMPPYCHDLLDRSLLFERLRRTLDAVPVSDARWGIVDLELDALVRGDVPLFSTQASRLALQEAAGKGKPVAVKGTTPVMHALQCLRRLDRQQRVRNDELITSALEANEWPSVTVRNAWAFPNNHARDSWPGRYAAAVQLFSIVRRRCYISSADGSIAIVAATLDASGRAQQVGVADPADTYSGVAGLGLLAAGLHAIRPRRLYRDTAKRVADTLSVALDSLAGAARPERAGAFSGPTGVAYVLHVLGDLLRERSYSDLARSLLITWEKAAGELSSDLDVVSGAAGACMVGLALAGRGGSEDRELSAFVASRAELLRASAIVEGDACFWPDTGATGKSGFAHGSAGIATALGRLADGGFVRDDEADPLMSAAVASELRAFHPAASGWLHTATSARSPKGTAAGWCYGGAGMLLATHTLESRGSGAALLREKAVQAILSESPAADGLCHGLGGSSAVLWHHGRLRGDENLVSVAQQRLDHLARRCQAGQSLRVEPTSSLAHSAGLMTGSTGVALALLSPELDHVAARLLAVA